MRSLTASMTPVADNSVVVPDRELEEEKKLGRKALQQHTASPRTTWVSEENGNAAQEQHEEADCGDPMRDANRYGMGWGVRHLDVSDFDGSNVRRLRHTRLAFNPFRCLESLLHWSLFP
jgi:hypothetical protein